MRYVRAHEVLQVHTRRACDCYDLEKLVTLLITLPSRQRLLRALCWMQVHAMLRLGVQRPYGASAAFRMRRKRVRLAAAADHAEEPDIVLDLPEIRDVMDDSLEHVSGAVYSVVKQVTPRTMSAFTVRHDLLDGSCRNHSSASSFWTQSACSTHQTACPSVTATSPVAALKLSQVLRAAHFHHCRNRVLSHRNCEPSSRLCCTVRCREAHARRKR